MSRLSETLQDLSSLEINTIIKANMTARKMPDIPFALLDIIEKYGEKLDELGVDLSVYFRSYASSDYREREMARLDDLLSSREGGARPRGSFNEQKDLRPLFEDAQPSERPEAFSMERTHNGWDTFERLRLAARSALKRSELREDPTARTTLLRIRKNCDQLKHLVRLIELRSKKGSGRWSEVIPKTRNELVARSLERTADEPSYAEELTLIQVNLVRKAWELGVESVLAQTVIQTDGDVVTRISNELVQQHGDEVRRLILSAHSEGVGGAIQHWNSLVKVAVDLVVQLVKSR